ncbi:YndJ family protein [Kolteria novifilia]
MRSKDLGLLFALLGATFWGADALRTRASLFETAWAVELLLFSPLVLVPLALRLFVEVEDQPRPKRLFGLVVAMQFPAALLLLIAFWLPEGIGAFLTLPWLAMTGFMLLLGARRIWVRGWPQPWGVLAQDVGWVFLVVGAGWLMLSRLGARPLDFEPVIVLLTAIHFHYAGFLLPIFAGRAALLVGGRLADVTAIGVVVGVPLVAIGITATQVGLPVQFEFLAAAALAGAGLLVALLHLRLAMWDELPGFVRLMFGFVSLSLTFSMALAFAYGGRCFGWWPGLDIPWMRALHGTVNAFGFGLAGCVGWNLFPRRRLLEADPSDDDALGEMD